MQLQVVVGRGFSLGVTRELDVQLDDGIPDIGVVRATRTAPSIFAGGDEKDCATIKENSQKARGEQSLWEVGKDARDCNAVLLF